MFVWFDPRFTIPDPNSNERYSIKWTYSYYDFDVNAATTYKKGMYSKTGKEMIEYVGKTTVGPINIVYVSEHGDIGYAPGVLFPQRKYNVPHGVYPKKGWLKEN